MEYNFLMDPKLTRYDRTECIRLLGDRLADAGQRLKQALADPAVPHGVCRGIEKHIDDVGKLYERLIHE